MDNDILKILAPTVFVIFGATGDLGKKKLVPALFDLFKKGLLPESFHIFGFARREYDDTGFRSYLKKIIIQQDKTIESEVVDCFLEKVSYARGLFEDKLAYDSLRERIDGIENRFKVCTNKLYHLAVPPGMVESIIENLSTSGLTDTCSDDMGWTRVLVEKPFGKDIDTARKLDDKLGKLFRESQIFRIDHYLAKHTLQNILFFRFSNLLFEPVWNKRYIDRVSIRLLEEDDIGGRGGFYDGVGALRDVGQNHILQMLSLVAMENPASLESPLVRQERAKVIRALRPIDGGKVISDVTRAQYEGYRKSDGVDKDSDTETYFKVKAFIKNKKWQGVPFFLESGKALSKKRTDITVCFKQARPCLCPENEKGYDRANMITFIIQPEEAIHIRFWAKRQGIDKAIEPRDLSFMYENKGSKKISDYENIILDCMRGDQVLFASTEEIKASWDFITPLIDKWGKKALKIYKKGSDGP